MGYGSSDGISSYEAQNIADRAARDAASEAKRDGEYYTDRAKQELEGDIRRLERSIDGLRSCIDELRQELAELREGRS